MKLKHREKILLLVTVALLLAALGWFLLFLGDSGSIEVLRETYKSEEDKLAARTKERDAALRDLQRLADWRRRALPSDLEIAQSRYQTWLRNLAMQEVRFRQVSIEPKQTAAIEGKAKKDYTRFAFTLRGQANWAILIEFLFKFYSAGHLHQIREMRLQPARSSRDLDVTLTIEAMSLPGADRKEELSKEPGRALKLAKLAEYRDPIVRRELFAAYVRPTQKTSPDEARQTFVTGIIEIDGNRQVWIHNRLAGKHWKLKEGQDFQIGETDGKVLKIASAHEVIVDFDGRRRRLSEGDNLRGGVEVKD